MSKQNNIHDIYRRRMMEASMLPSDDPVRLELEAELESSQQWALPEWWNLLAESEQLRAELHDVQPPAGLAASLMRIPEDSRTVRPGALINSPLMRIAATVLLVLGVGGGMYWANDRGGTDERIEMVAELAIDSYIHDYDVSVITFDPGYLERHLDGSVPFPVKMPTVQSDLSLIGGRSGSLGVHPAVYTRWSHQSMDRTRCAIIQFRSRDFGLPESSAKEVVHSSNVDCPSAMDKDCNVVVWSEGGNGYALVADSACAMHCLGSK